MKTILGTPILALALLSATMPGLTSAQSSGHSANGVYRFVMEDEIPKSVEFEAHTDERGATTGQFKFIDEGTIVDRDPDAEDPRDETPPGFSITATLDGLTIENNRAVMSGTITESTHHNYIGKWVQLVVEDNGNNQERPDQVNWRMCQPEPGGWVPADAEEPRDEGAYWHWWATDFEYRDDVGIPSRNVIPGQASGCPSFSLSAYEFPALRGEGGIEVHP